VLLVCTVYSVLYSEIALSRKPFGIGHMYIYTFLHRMTDTMTARMLTFPPGTFRIYRVRVTITYVSCVLLPLYWIATHERSRASRCQRYIKYLHTYNNSSFAIETGYGLEGLVSILGSA
jgi:hypothetical protein